MRHFLLAIMALTSPVAVNASSKKVTIIPPEYQGSWSMDTAFCNYEGDTLDSELFVEAQKVGFHAEHHRVKSVIVLNGKIKVRYFPLEDATRVPPEMLFLSKDKLELNNTWFRCPKAAK